MQHVLEATLELLKQQLHASQDRESKLLAMLEQEQQARRDLEQRLLPPSQEQPPVWEAAAESAAGSAPDRAEDKRGFFGRLFGG